MSKMLGASLAAGVGLPIETGAGGGYADGGELVLAGVLGASNIENGVIGAADCAGGAGDDGAESNMANGLDGAAGCGAGEE